MGPRWWWTSNRTGTVYLRHAAAHNVIERSFGLLKTRWGILRSPSYYSIDVQNRIIVACCLLHNYVRREMPEDPIDCELHEDPNNAEFGNTEYMNVGDDEGNSNPRRYRVKADKINTRRTWTQWEEEALVNALHTICCTGWRCENDFRAGYLNQLEALMCKQFLNTDIRAEPHINSKIHVWKKFYSTLVGMMDKSGFGWDDSRCMITVDSQEVWDEFCKLFFPAWREIFGRDRAEGERIFKTTPEIVHTPKTNCIQTDTQECYVPTAEWCLEFGYAENDKAISDEIQVTPDPNVHSTASHIKSGSTSKKRKRLKVSDDDGLSNAVSTFYASADARLGEISKKLFVDFLEVEKRSAVFEAVGNIPGIDLNDQILISDRLVDDPKKMDLFFSLPEEARARMIGLMLNGKV
ncbi:UNVERIFIED_CONTAM: hypothetical protein Slati_0834400 [Sesamum latifolium]|uniref:Myb/SANT-like domain-containing protein n=1 Tax=Sesamum latifolium TaxID=2727402 RepID=A0AAW2XPT2_9LAMI